MAAVLPKICHPISAKTSSIESPLSLGLSITTGRAPVSRQASIFSSNPPAFPLSFVTIHAI